MSFLDLRDSWENPYGLYLLDKFGWIRSARHEGKLVWESYNYDINFIHPVKFNGDLAKANRHN